MEHQKQLSLKELQLFSLDILKDIHLFCEANHIKYSLYGGTLLGAIRHKGFIPWDDDIDVIMPRPDYDKFCRSYKSSAFELVCRDTDDSFQLAYARVCDNKKTIYTAVEPCSKEPTGVWIDVFPADGGPNSQYELEPFYHRILKLFEETEKVRFSMASYSIDWSRIFDYRMWRANIHLFLRKFWCSASGKKDTAILKLIALSKTYKFGATPYWASLGCPYKHPVYNPIDSFSTCSLMDFEDSQFYVMSGWDGYLRRVYGDYMELPPIEKRYPPLEYLYSFYWR